MSIANYFTFVRIVMSPIFLFTYLKYEMLGIPYTVLPILLLIFLTISEFSDALDGFLARRYNQVTDLGKVLDPMADSIARISVFLTFTLEPVLLPMPLIFIFLYRDSIVSTLRTICALKGFALAARTSGKIKAVIQACAAFIIIGMMIPYSQNLLSIYTLQKTAAYVTTLAALYTIYSGCDYVYANWSYIRKMLKPQTSESQMS